MSGYNLDDDDSFEQLSIEGNEGLGGDFGFGTHTEEDFFDSQDDGSDAIQDNPEEDILQPLSVENDEAAKWLAQANLDQVDPSTAPNQLQADLATLETQGTLISEMTDTTGKSNVDVTGQASLESLIELRWSGMEPRQQAYMVNVLRNPALMGQRSKHEDITANSAVAAVKEFGHVLEGDPSKIADTYERKLREINNQAEPVLQTVGPRKGSYIGGEIRATTDPAEQKMIMGMLGITQSVKLERGSGTALAGYHMSPERQKKADKDLEWLAEFMPVAADVYGNQNTKRLEPALYEARHQETQKALTKYWSKNHPAIPVLEYATGLQKVDDNGKLMFESTNIPLNSDLDVFGIGGNSNQLQWKSGTGHDRLSYAALYPSQDELTEGGTTAWSQKAYDASDAAKYTVDELSQMKPSGRVSTYFNEERFGSAAKAKKAYKKFQKRAKKAKRIIQAEALTTLDENFQNTRRSLAFDVTEEEALSSEARNTARIYDFDQQKEQTDGLTLKNLPSYTTASPDEQREIDASRVGQGTVMGSDKGGMYSDEGMSETDRFEELVKAGMPHDEAAALIIDEVETSTTGFEEVLPGNTDRDRYLRRVAREKKAGRFADQGTKAWLEEKRGLLSASMTGRIDKEYGKKGQRDLANQLIDPDMFIPTKYVGEGSKWEGRARKEFEKFTGFEVEDAFLETNKEAEGYGVSPDGYVYDKYGESQGLVEFKVHNSEKALLRGKKDYNKQMQLQMHITGQRQVHFFRINEETSKIGHSIIEYDQEVVDEILAGGENVFKLREELMRKNLDDEDEEMTADDQAHLERKGKIKKEHSYRKKKKKKEEVKAAYKTSKNLDIEGEEEDTIQARLMAEAEKEGNTLDIGSAKERKRFAKAEEQELLDAMKEGNTLDAGSAKERTKEAKAKETDRKNDRKHEDDVKRMEKENVEELNAMTMEMKQQEVAASKEASQNLRQMGMAANQAAKGLLSIIGKGTETQVGDIRLSKETGMDVDRVRGQTHMLEQAGLTEDGAEGVIRQAFELRKTALDPVAGHKQYTQMRSRLAGIASKAGVSTPHFPGYAELSNMETGDIPSWALGMTSGFEDQALKATALGALNMGKLAMANDTVDPEELKDARMTVKVEQALKAQKAVTDARMLKETLQEEAVNNIVDVTGSDGMAVGMGMAALAGTGLTAKAIMSKGNPASTVRAASQAAKSALPKAASLMARAGGTVANVARTAVAAAGTSGSAAALSAAAIATTGVLAAGAAGYAVGSMAYDNTSVEGQEAIGDFIGGIASYIPGTEAHDMRTDETIPNSKIGQVRGESISSDKEVKVSTQVESNITVTLGEDVVMTTVEDNYGNSKVDSQIYGGTKN